MQNIDLVTFFLLTDILNKNPDVTKACYTSTFQMTPKCQVSHLFLVSTAGKNTKSC